MTRVLLISPMDNTSLENDIYPRLGILTLGSILSNKGHYVKIVHMASDQCGVANLLETIESEEIEVVGITLTTYQTKWTYILMRGIKSLSPDIKVVLGGPHVSGLGSETFREFPLIDTIVIGEGELALETILNSSAKIVTKARVEDLDTLPFPKLELVDINKFSGPYPIGRLPSMYIMGSRGCPNYCTFCFKYSFSRTVRYHSPEYILDLISYYSKTYGIREISFLDDTLNLNRKWLETILEGIISEGYNKKVAFRGAFRVNEKLVDLDLLKLVKKAGFWNIFYGVESGNQSMLDRMQKRITIEEVKRAYKLTHQVGIKTEAPFIIGLPGETEDTIKDSIKLFKELKPFIGGFARAQPFPGTAFREEVQLKGHLLPIPFEEYSYNKMLVRTADMTTEELDKWAKKCNRMIMTDLIKQCILNPTLLPKTVKAVGLRELISKVLKNIK